MTDDKDVPRGASGWHKSPRLALSLLFWGAPAISHPKLNGTWTRPWSSSSGQLCLGRAGGDNLQNITSFQTFPFSWESLFNEDFVCLIPLDFLLQGPIISNNAPASAAPSSAAAAALGTALGTALNSSLIITIVIYITGFYKHREGSQGKKPYIWGKRTVYIFHPCKQGLS